MNGIEERIWNYIDGNCSAEERQAMDILIATDETYKRKFHELEKLNIDFSCMQLDEPSMGFGYKVMETIRTENATKPLKVTVDQRIIKGIAAFFILGISLCLIFAFATANWSAAGASSLDIKLPDLSGYFSGAVTKGFIVLDIVLALYLFDSYLRKKLNRPQAQ